MPLKAPPGYTNRSFNKTIEFQNRRWNTYVFYYCVWRSWWWTNIAWASLVCCEKHCISISVCDDFKSFVWNFAPIAIIWKALGSYEAEIFKSIKSQVCISLAQNNDEVCSNLNLITTFLAATLVEYICFGGNLLLSGFETVRQQSERRIFYADNKPVLVLALLVRFYNCKSNLRWAYLWVISRSPYSKNLFMICCSRKSGVNSKVFRCSFVSCQDNDHLHIVEEVFDDFSIVCTEHILMQILIDIPSRFLPFRAV